MGLGADVQGELMSEENTLTHAEARKRIDDWLPYTEGHTFEAKDVWAQFNVYSAEGKHNIAQVLSNYKRKGILAGDRGRFRHINRELETLDWVDADPGHILDIHWPIGFGDGTSFGFDNNLTLYPDSIVIFSGESNRGKSALQLNVLVRNMDDWKCRYLTNEMGREELKDRLDSFAGYYELTDVFGDPKFEAAVRYDNYEDVILPGGLTIIDYLDPGENPYMVGQQIDAIRQRLAGGVAFISLQKKRGAEYGAGGQYSEHRARIVLHLSTGEDGREYLLVKKAKKCRIQNLNGKKFAFGITNNGSQFYGIRPYTEGEEA
ncbi:hypothetical protein LCGC14_2310670 [marine sediment metagenome]|uniref:SF4 helicase domain-containing protein n=1 Tax=marine sediment metagenome TaxID=412755 RepID=A0A0F9CKS1_9ZZZZ